MTTYDRSHAFAVDVFRMFADTIRTCGDLREVLEQIAERHREDIAEIKLEAAGERLESID
jgi:hypothetical protein